MVNTVKDKILINQQDLLEDLSLRMYNLYSILDLAHITIADMNYTDDTYTNTRMKAFEGIFNMLKIFVKDTDEEIKKNVDVLMSYGK